MAIQILKQNIFRFQVSVPLMAFALFGILCGAFMQNAHAEDTPAPEVSAEISPTQSDRKHIHIVGSSTVYPFSTVVAERFARNTGLLTPVIESNGTGGGMELFCKGVGLNTPDIVDASRPMKDSERQLCAKNRVRNITEIKIGYDGIVLATSGDTVFNLSLKEIWYALAAQIPDKSGLMPNTNNLWSDINKKLPETKIVVYGPPSTSGTYDSFIEMVMEKGCPVNELALKRLDSDEKKAACTQLREDGQFITASEDDNLIVQKLLVEPESYGIFGFGFLLQNQDRLKGLSLENQAPTAEAIIVGGYPVARSMYLYVKNEHASQVMGLKEYLIEYLSEASVGEFGYLVSRGMVPLPSDERIVQRQLLDNLPSIIPVPEKDADTSDK